MADGYKESITAVQSFLKELNRILSDPTSKLEIQPREDKAWEYTTTYCLQTLGLDTDDIKSIVLKLTEKNYIETCDDERNKKANRYYVFGINIDKREIYIKVKIKSYDNKIVLCMSFHFAEYPLKRAYK